MEELHSLDPRRQELLEARFMGGVGGSTGGSTGSTSGGTKVSQHFSLGIGLLNEAVTFIVSVNIVPKNVYFLYRLWLIMNVQIIVLEALDP